jgi:hypothetical protein
MAMAARRSTSISKTSPLGLPPYLDVAPRHGTLRDFRNPTYGPRIAKIHRLLTRRNPLPWQQYVYDVVGEVDPKTGIRIYREVDLTTMRQVGKTTIVRTLKVHRALDCLEPQTILFAAQDGIEAKNKWLEHAELIKRTPLGKRLASPDEPTTSNGKENLVWGNLSTERPISSKPASGHGDTLDAGFVTEAFSQVDDRYENTMLPAMNVRPDAQLFVESTEGTAASLYWNERVDELRERLEAEPKARGRSAGFDWSFSPDDDPASPETWLRRIPSLGPSGIMRVDEVQFAFDRATTPAKMRQFLRGFGNIRDLGAAEGTMFEPDVWEAGERPGSHIAGAITFALDISPDRSYSTIGVGGRSTQRGSHVGIVARERGTHWVIAYLVRKMAEVESDTVYIASNGPAALMVDDLEKVGLNVVVLNRAEVAAACGGLFDDIVAGDISYTPGQDALNAAVGGAVWTGGDVRTFSRGSSTVDISPLYAIAIARYGSTLAAADYNVLDTIA